MNEEVYEPVIEVCSLCGNSFVLGFAGIIMGEDEIPICDDCAGVERDAEGNVWLPGETQKTFQPISNQYQYHFTISREEAFAGPYADRYLGLG